MAGCFQAGFTVIVQDVILGSHLAEMTAMIRSRPLLIIVLAPQAAAIADRDDTTSQTPTETADEILSRAWTEALIPEQAS